MIEVVHPRTDPVQSSKKGLASVYNQPNPRLRTIARHRAVRGLGMRSRPDVRATRRTMSIAAKRQWRGWWRGGGGGL